MIGAFWGCSGWSRAVCLMASDLARPEGRRYVVRWKTKWEMFSVAPAAANFWKQREHSVTPF